MIRVRNPHPELVDVLKAEWQAKLEAGEVSEKELEERFGDPLAHGGHDDDQSGEHGPGGDASSDGNADGDEHSLLHSPRRSLEDSGYTLSLKVLGSATGVTL